MAVLGFQAGLFKNTWSQEVLKAKNSRKVNYFLGHFPEGLRFEVEEVRGAGVSPQAWRRAANKQHLPLRRCQIGDRRRRIRQGIRRWS